MRPRPIFAHCPACSLRIVNSGIDDDDVGLLVALHAAKAQPEIVYGQRERLTADANARRN